MGLIKRGKWIIAYVILILIFALTYNFMPSQSFHINSDNFSFIDWLYFSVVTITTLGYGEITPAVSVSKILVVSESLLGLLLLGLFLNSEAQNAIDKRDKKYVINALDHSFRMLAFIEEYLNIALNNKSNQNNIYKERFEEIANKLKFQPEIFNFNKRILDNIYWGSKHAVNDLRLIALNSKALSDDAFLYISTIITNLENIEDYNIDSISPVDRKPGPESMQHRIHIVFKNAAILCDLVKSKKTKFKID